MLIGQKQHFTILMWMKGKYVYSLSELQILPLNSFCLFLDAIASLELGHDQGYHFRQVKGRRLPG